MEKLYSSWN